MSLHDQDHPYWEPDRDYQSRTRERVHCKWSQGARAVLVVSPTGSGKTHMGTRIALDSGHGTVLWVAHRRELVRQAHDSLVAHLGSDHVGMIMAGVCANSGARVQVGSIDTLLARGIHPPAGLLIFDEAHHYVADSYRSLVEHYPQALRLGLTATPQRADGRPLGDIFDELVVAADYSELLSAGHLVPVDVIRPRRFLEGDLVMDPIDAWGQYSRRQSTFMFLSRVAEAEEAVRRLRARGSRAEVIESRTGRTWRDDVIALFKSHRVDVLASVYALAEGVDIPDARVALSCRTFQHDGAMLQAFGRVLRPAKGKARALIIDLTGATHRHGLPTEDRDYSLEGRAIAARSTGSAGASHVHDQEVVGGDLEVATLGEPPDPALATLPLASRRATIRSSRLRAIRLKHGMRAVEFAADYLDRLG